jgi:hypothetical protein
LRHLVRGVRWPVDDLSEQDLASHLVDLGVGKQVRERLLLERSIVRRHGFACFADFFTARRALGWRPGCLKRRDRPGIGWAA